MLAGVIIIEYEATQIYTVSFCLLTIFSSSRLFRLQHTLIHAIPLINVL